MPIRRAKRLHPPAPHRPLRRLGDCHSFAPDAIPAIDDPRFLTAAEAAAFYDPDELVIGVAFGDEDRAYSVPFLSRHEIVNDEVGGVKFAVTW